MALYFGSRLARAGIEVRLLGSWEEGLAAINRDGICLLEDEETISEQLFAIEDMAENIAAGRGTFRHG